jgi:hypothetical protein
MSCSARGQAPSSTFDPKLLLGEKWIVSRNLRELKVEFNDLEWIEEIPNPWSNMGGSQFMIVFDRQEVGKGTRGAPQCRIWPRQ